MKTVTISLAKPSDLTSISHMLAKSFHDYPLFHPILGPLSDNEQKNCQSLLHLINLKAYLSQNCIYVATYDHKPSAVLILQPPTYTEPHLGKYLSYGGLKLLKYLSIKDIWALKSIKEKASKTIKESYPNAFYIELLAVDPDSQSAGLGSQLLAFAKDQLENGQQVILVTSREKNRYFYQKNGFMEVADQTIPYQKLSIPNYAYLFTKL